MCRLCRQTYSAYHADLQEMESEIPPWIGKHSGRRFPKDLTQEIDSMHNMPHLSEIDPLEILQQTRQRLFIESQRRRVSRRMQPFPTALQRAIQWLMEACLAEANFDILLIYLDDILVFS